jgi:hypothetical protein
LGKSWAEKLVGKKWANKVGVKSMVKVGEKSLSTPKIFTHLLKDFYPIYH